MEFLTSINFEKFSETLISNIYGLKKKKNVEKLFKLFDIIKLLSIIKQIQGALSCIYILLLHYKNL